MEVVQKHQEQERSLRLGMTTVASIWILVAAGGAGNFGVYSEDMKVSLSYSQKSINTIAFFRDLGLYTCIHCGILYQKFGALVTLLVAAFLNLSSHILTWAVARKKLHFSNVWFVSVLFFFVANSHMFVYTISLMTLVRQFPKQRGAAILVVGAMFGLSPAILAFFFQAVSSRGDHTIDYILLNGCFSFGVYVLALPFFYHKLTAYTTKSRTLKYLLGLAFLVAGYLFVGILVKILVSKHQVLVSVPTAILLACILVSFPFVLRNERHPQEPEERGQMEKQDVENCANHKEQTIESDLDKDKLDVEEFQRDPAQATANVQKVIELGDDFGVWQALKSPEMLLLLVASMCGMGSALATVDNLGQIGTAWGYSISQVTNFMSLMNIWNFLGRAVITLASEFLLRRNGIPRPVFLAIAQALTALALVVVAFKLTPAAFYLAAAMAGFCSGAQITLIVTITSELFGLLNFAILYSLGLAVGVAGTYIVNVPLVGVFYDRVARQQNSPVGGGSDSELVCYGERCYRNSFLIMAGVCAFGCGACLVLAGRTRELYRRIQRRN